MSTEQQPEEQPEQQPEQQPEEQPEQQPEEQPEQQPEEQPEEQPESVPPTPTVTVTRYEMYPSEEPTCYCVGFSITCPSGRKTMYRDTQVALTDAQGKTEQEIADMAYTSLKESIDQWVCTEMTKPRILGSQFTPSSVS